MSKKEKEYREDLIDMKELLGIELFSHAHTIPSTPPPLQNYNQRRQGEEMISL